MEKKERPYTMLRFNKARTKRELVKMAKAQENGNLNLLINKMLEQIVDAKK